ncbi:MAG TPA: NAD(P)/FAD-dependent oxidoreductase [Thermoplasmata archaeon]|nr:NAD(P)/FAD-dependent oxidoreductase [Thermoplasmata archaeon]
MKYDVIVIGAGAGGSACAALLSARGYKTLLTEKNNWVGGKAATVEKFGHKVDLFAHLLAGGGAEVKKVLEETGKSGTLEIIAKDPVICFVTEDGTHLGFGFEYLKDMLSGILVDTDEELERTYEITLDQYLKEINAPGPLRAAMNVMTLMYFVISAKYASAGEFILSSKKIIEGDPPIGYPKGGIGKIAETFVDTLKENGGELLRKRVEKILVEEGRALGVRADDGSIYEGRAIVSNAGIQATVLKLVGEDHFTKEYIDRVKSLYPSLGAIRIWYFLDTKLVSEPSLVYMPTSMPSKEIREGERNLPEPGGYVMVPSNFDPDLSPHGKQVLIATMSAPAHQKFDQKEANGWFDVLHDTVKKMIPNLEEHIEHVDYRSSDFIAKISGRDGIMDKVGGECIGLSQTPSQVGKNKPDPRSPIEGLFQVGADAGGVGIGVDLAVNSARNVSKIVSDYLK